MKLTRICLLIGILVMSQSIMSMNESNMSFWERMARGLVETAGHAVNNVVRTVDDIRERAQRRTAERRRELDNIINTYPANSSIRQNAEQELQQLLQRQQTMNDRLDDLATGANETLMNGMQAAINAGQTFAQEHAQREARIAVAREEGQASVQRAAVQTHMVLNALTDPVKVGGIALASFGTYYGLKFGYQVLEEWYRVPTLADKTTIIPWYKKFYNWINNIHVFNATLDDVVLNQKLKNFFRDYVKGTKNIIENDGYLGHLLLPGPPGTGKTMTSIAIANELGIPAIYFAASNLRNYKVEDAITKLRQLFNYAKSQGPIVIIMDEAELIFGSRDKSLGEEIRIAANKIMSETGTEQSNFILIALTNRVQDFDMAFKSRFNNIVEVGPPAASERRKLVEMYVNKYIKKPKFNKKKSWIKRVFGKTQTNVSFDQKLFDKNGIDKITQQINGFTGRNISHLIMEIRKKAFATKDITITQKIIDSAIKDMKIKVAEEYRCVRNGKTT